MLSLLIEGKTGVSIDSHAVFKADAIIIIEHGGLMNHKMIFIEKELELQNN